MVLRYEWIDDENDVIMRDKPATIEVESRSDLMGFLLTFEKDKEGEAHNQFERIHRNLKRLLEKN